MPPLSAVDAIVPAWEHTRRLLLGPRDPRLLFKLAAVAFFAELGGGFNFNGGLPGRAGHGLPHAVALLIVPLLMALVGVGLLLGLLMFYVGSRLQFVLFHVVLRGETQIAPIWRRYGPATWRWIGVKVLFALAAVACMAPVVVPGILLLIRSLHRNSQNASALFPAVAGALGFAGAIFLLVFVIAIVFVLLRDFGLPSMALEATPVQETVRRIVALVRLEPGQMGMFVLMRFVLGLAAAFASYAVLFMLGLVAAIPLGGFGLGLWAGLHRSAASGKVFMIAGWAVLGVAFAALLVVAAIALFGYAFTFLQAYAIFFLAGRYPLLAAQLQPAFSVPAPRTAWPPAFYPPPQPPAI